MKKRKIIELICDMRSFRVRDVTRVYLHKRV